MIDFDHTICGDLAEASRREWLETNGLGGFASSTITGMNRRRYHGLLVAATAPPAGRTALLSKLEETLVLGDRRFELSCNQYPGVVHPQGHRYLKRFRLDPFPLFSYEVEGIHIEKAVFLVYGENTTVVQYRLEGQVPGGQDCKLEVRPLLSFRDYHWTTHENPRFNREVALSAGLISMTPYPELPTLHLAHNAANVSTECDWYHCFRYDAERDRGLDYEEDLFNPCVLSFHLDKDSKPAIIASTKVRNANSANTLRTREVARRNLLTEIPGLESPFVQQLVRAADQFIVSRGRQKTVIAGYHWFADWGRDTMISLAGLTLATRRYDIAKGILLAFSRHISQGMLPNRFPESGETPEYNSVDAALWYFEAIRDYFEATHDESLLRKQLYPLLMEIIDWHVKGTRFSIRVEENGLLHAGSPDIQLTWMDASIDGKCVTPRNGLAVEIQALWYNALRVVEAFARRFVDLAAADRLSAMAARAQSSFNQLFWNNDAGCLYDFIDGDQRDASIRPNQVFAVSLPHPILASEKTNSVLNVVQRELLTPYGLRTLSPSDPKYMGHYEGDQRSRDSAYHQGTVWPWLLGPFITAYLKVHEGSMEARAQTREWISSFEQQMTGAGLGQISEIFDGDPPHTPRGCIAQAWSVAELLRVAVEL